MNSLEWRFWGYYEYMIHETLNYDSIGGVQRDMSFLDEQHVVSLAEIRRSEVREQFLTSDKKVNKKKRVKKWPVN